MILRVIGGPLAGETLEVPNHEPTLAVGIQADQKIGRYDLVERWPVGFGPAELAFHWAGWSR